MTGQTPERIIFNGRPHSLAATPLYRLLNSRRINVGDYVDCYTTACWRKYIGTWVVRNGVLFLAHLNLAEDVERPLPDALRRRILHGTSSEDFPIPAQWFNGTLRITIGRRLVYSHHGFDSWYERERVLSIRGVKVVRDREVDTRKILEWALQRDPGRSGWLLGDDIKDTEPSPLVWLEPITDDKEEDWLLEWWPPDCDRALLL